METKRIGFAINIDIWNRLQELKKEFHGASDRQVFEILLDKEYQSMKKIKARLGE